MSLVSSLDQAEEERRARKLEAAKKKLKTFRATRTPGASTSTSHLSHASSSSTKSSLSSRSPRLGIAVLPLTTEHGGNVSLSSNHNRVNSKGKGKMAEGSSADVAQGLGSGMGGMGMGMGHERTRSGAKASGRHRRQNSSISGPLLRPAPPPPLPLFQSQGQDEGEDRKSGLRLNEYKFNLPIPVPREITMTPATPLVETNELSDPFSFTSPAASAPGGEEDLTAVKQRLTAFSFGSKPSLCPVSPSRSPTASPNRRSRQPPLLPSAALRAHDLNFPPPFPFAESGVASTSTSISAPAGLDKLGQTGLTPSRPPSLLFTTATPHLATPSTQSRLPHSTHPSLAGIAAFDSPSPSTPPTAARRRHSHTRSNSISLSNLKIGGARPISLGIPSSPSFPSSPGSPISPDDSTKGARTPINGTRLKFEPSEAEMAKEESRRKALEKLNGTSPAASPIMDEQPVAEISLPDLEDDTSSTSSSSRPLSGAWGSSSSSSSSFSFGRPNSLNSSPGVNGYTHTATPAIEPSLFPAWPADDAAPMSFDRWSSGFKEESLGFGMELMPKRGSFQGALAVLPEVEETEEENEVDDEDVREEEDMPSWGNRSSEENTDQSDVSVEHSTTPIGAAQTPTVQPTSSKLRELHLLSSGPIATPLRPPSSADSSSSAIRARPAPISPTKGYGTIGRGRPRPLSGIMSANANAKSSLSTNTSSPLTANVITPKTARMSAPRRRLSGSGRRSSISYKKDKEGGVDNMSAGSSLSSRWSINSRSMVSPPPSNEMTLASPPLPSPRGSLGWAHVPRSTNRPCPRPKSLVGLGLSQSGSGPSRILSEVVEKDESGEVGLGLGIGMGDGWNTAPLPTHRPFTFRSFGSLDMDVSGEMDLGGRASLDVDSEGEGRWRDGMLELEMERDALREDVDGWRERCKGLEERLEDEKRESGVLRQRMRKLSDRLLTLSTTPHSPARSAPTASPESRVMGEMKGQLFSLTSAFERERRDKDAALHQIEQLQAELNSLRANQSTPQWSFSPYQSPPSTFETQQQLFNAPALVPSLSQSPAAPSSQLGGFGEYNYPWPSTPIVTPATPAMLTPDHSALFASPSKGSEQYDDAPSDAYHPTSPESSPQPDLNGFRIRAWGFPSSRSPSPSQPVPSLDEPTSFPPSTRQSKRESFFGLSKVPQPIPEMVETEMYDDGVDLPPFILPPHLSASIGLGPPHPGMIRAVSDPLPATPTRHSTSLHPILDDPPSSSLSKSASTTSFSTSAFSLIAGYLPSRSSPTKTKSELYSHTASGATSHGRVGMADMRLSCRCCVGDVIEL